MALSCARERGADGGDRGADGRMATSIAMLSKDEERQKIIFDSIVELTHWQDWYRTNLRYRQLLTLSDAKSIDAKKRSFLEEMEAAFRKK